MRFVNPIPFVRDIAQSKAFYEKTLGLTIQQDFGSFVLFEGGFATHEGEALEQMIWGKASKDEQPYGRHNLLLYFEHDDVDAAFAAIAPHVDLIHRSNGRHGDSVSSAFTTRTGMPLKLANRRISNQRGA